MNDWSIQVTNINNNTLVTAKQGDIIIVSQQDVWEIAFNIKTGTVESWKVICFMQHEKMELFILLFYDATFIWKLVFLLNNWNNLGFLYQRLSLKVF